MMLRTLGDNENNGIQLIAGLTFLNDVPIARNLFDGK